MLGLVALFTDVATEMAMPLLPAFMATLGAGAIALGLVEGLADFTAAILKFYSGKISDASGKRRPWVLGGYFLSSLVRPLLALSGAAWQVVAVRVADRTGKGLRTSPRDAMLADSVHQDHHGAAFGFHQSLDNLGQVIGPLIAVALLLWAGLGLRTIFWLTAIPGAIAVLVILGGVVEVAPKQKGPAPQPGAYKPSADFRAFLIPLAIFNLGASSDLFLLYKANAENMPLWWLPLFWVALAVVKSLSSVPGGWLADKIKPRIVISLGWAYYALIYVLFAFCTASWQFLALFVAYGIYYGLTEAPEKAMVSRLAGSANRGAAFGWYNLVVGLLSLPASIFFGWLWDAYGSRAAFLSGAAFSLAGLALLWLMPRLRSKHG